MADLPQTLPKENKLPSLRHALIVQYIQKFKRHPYPGSDTALRDELTSIRGKEHSGPPRRIRDHVQSSELDGFPVHTYRPTQIRNGARIVYLHGGAYVRDLTYFHWRFIARLGDSLGLEVVVPQYPLAPEATWQESREALLQLVTEPSSQRTFLVGDSAGGGLALALAQRAVAQGASPAGLVLVAPWVDLTIDPTYGTVDNDPWLEPVGLRAAGRLWAGRDDVKIPALSPLNGEWEGLPPTLTFCGTRDIVLPGVIALTAFLAEAGIDVRSITGEGLIHVYPLLPIPEAQDALDQITKFLNDLSA